MVAPFTLHYKVTFIAAVAASVSEMHAGWELLCKPSSCRSLPSSLSLLQLLSLTRSVTARPQSPQFTQIEEAVSRLEWEPQGRVTELMAVMGQTDTAAVTVWISVWVHALKCSNFEATVGEILRSEMKGLDCLQEVPASWTVISHCCCVVLVWLCGRQASRLAVERGWAINLGGGFHHCSADHGGGFCVYADITLAIRFLFSQVDSIKQAMIVDLDAHQVSPVNYQFDSPTEPQFVSPTSIFNFFAVFLEENLWGISGIGLLQDGFSLCRPTNHVKALKKT